MLQCRAYTIASGVPRKQKAPLYAASEVRARRGMTSTTRRRTTPRKSARLGLRPEQLTWVLISGFFVVAFVLRAWGARFGLPEYVYHPDEHAIVDRAAAILRTGDYSPHWFNYPSTYTYLQALSYIPYFLISAARGFGNTIPDPAPYGFYFAGRLMTAFVGALTVPLVYALGARLFGRRTGLLSSALLSFCLLHVVHSHYVTTDVPAAFFVTLSLLFCSLLLQSAEKRYTVLAGLFAGLAASTKYPAAVALVPVLATQLLARSTPQGQTLARRLGLSVAVFAGGFLLGTPYAVLELTPSSAAWPQCWATTGPASRDSKAATPGCGTSKRRSPAPMRL